MRSFALAVVGLVALGRALPTAEGRNGLEGRQRIGPVLGTPTTHLVPGNERIPSRPNKSKWFVPIPLHEEDDAVVSRRAVDDAEDLLSTFEALARKYTDRNPPLSVYLILQHIASLLEEDGRSTDVVFLGPAQSSLQVGSSTSKARRQDGVFGIGGNCNVDDLVGLLLTYSSLRSIYGPNPPTQIQNLKDAIYAALKYCNMDPEVGGIVPDPTRPGAPINPDPARPGAPMSPEPVRPGAPMVPEPYKTGAPLVAAPNVQGAPMAPAPNVQGAPLTPAPKVEGAPMVPGS